MGDAKVKPPFFGNQPYQQASTSKAMTGPAHADVVDQQKACSSNLKSVGKDEAAAKSPCKYEQLKTRKAELEKKLNEKYAQLQQVKREEAQLIGMYPSDFSAGVGSQDQNGTAPTLRRKIGTSFKLPENLLNNKEDDINKLLLEKQIQQQISEASLRLSNDTSQPKSVRRTHKQSYENAQQKLLAINQNLSVLKKRQQAAEQQKPPATRDDIDLHKCNNASRFRSNSNSSNMMMMSASERRNSVKSNTSSNHSISLNSSVGSGSKQQQLMVQIPGQHPGHYHSQQISPYSIHSGTLCVMPSGSQSMTPAASAAMVSQLSMLRHRARHDSISGIVNYDFSGSAADAAKMSPVSSGSGHHHHPHSHQHFQQQMQHPSQSPQSGPSRLNKLIHQQMHSYSPPPGHGGSPGYVMSPPASASSAAVEQAFVYDAKIISRLQPPPPPPPLPAPAHVPLKNSAYNNSGSTFDAQQETSAGLGGYWMMLETGEKVWCSVDNRFASLDRKQAGGSMKLSRSKLNQYPHAVPTKSNSMGNFDFINKQHQQQIDDSNQQDTISVTSGSSEHKRREKVWRETSLDSPVVKHKTLPSPSSSPMSNPPPLPAYPQPPPPPMQMQTSVQTPLHINVDGSYAMSSASPLLLSPQQMRYYQQKQQQILEHQRQQRLRIKQLEEQKQQAYLREQQQHQQHLLQQKLLRTPPQPPKHRNHYTQSLHVPNQQHLDLLPRSSQYYDSENHNLPPHYYQCQETTLQSNLSSRHPDLLISPTLSTSSSNTLTSPTLRQQCSISPTPSTLTTTSAGATIHSTPDIQTESPKNVTVVQQGKIQPYKEVTKPFEMSDFYKYSTKYRQKQQQQLQQHQHLGQLSPNGNSCEGASGSNTSGEVIQKTIYQPPNPSICHPINYN
ncbi:TPR-containing protein DDB_G0280363 [Topomyia yanbarensis]|uniref:TPR-containing protein DDB_G0280363 n=1 Tax=Topomyia yanbarensis TaxID=2498891 RepID=UPI00273AC354|nr:TPR-containing protein DDB_G0280363 [Topomyia yanbarensis]XP_058825649.1 TPR-containing protein DDB_G0280363 [Topomyia yanbarensis]XP_058825650.1 TPR-containing protein DDB_G0280363 [Topomyia yanbarensis]XP_058825651.1 TPR-containing protein DDB_G0280363 [Topomyia yanbarensis]XP_058825652.1 TPR-containing protein DDB_G0280363 [Topomyia yanbarensis]